MIARLQRAVSKFSPTTWGLLTAIVVLVLYGVDGAAGYKPVLLTAGLAIAVVTFIQWTVERTIAVTIADTLEQALKPIMDKASTAIMIHDDAAVSYATLLTEMRKITASISDLQAKVEISVRLEARVRRIEEHLKLPSGE